MYAGVLSPELEAALGAAVEEKEREGASKRELARFVDETAGALADPIIVYPGGWEDTLPKWLRDQIPLDRLLLMMEAKGKRIEKGTDSEAMAYLYTASYLSPMGYVWTNIYLWLGQKVMKTGLMAPQGKGTDKVFDRMVPQKLSADEQQFLEDLKAWIYRKRAATRPKASRAAAEEAPGPSPLEVLPALPPPAAPPKKRPGRKKKIAAAMGARDIPEAIVMLQEGLTVRLPFKPGHGYLSGGMWFEAPEVVLGDGRTLAAEYEPPNEEWPEGFLRAAQLFDASTVPEEHREGPVDAEGNVPVWIVVDPGTVDWTA